MHRFIDQIGVFEREPVREEKLRTGRLCSWKMEKLLIIVFPKVCRENFKLGKLFPEMIGGFHESVR